MISSAINKKIKIHITTYKRDGVPEEKEMNAKANNRINNSNKFVCAICLNTKHQDKSMGSNRNQTKPCPICQKSCNYCQNSIKKDRERTITEPTAHVKDVQTSDTNVVQGLNLLNEVLSVFQNKKEKDKAAVLKDVGVSTEDIARKKQANLTINTFHYSIDETKKPENGKFTIVSSCQPDYIRNENSRELIRHKSSSIPRMKMEELKYSLKEKSRSKDAIEEVNRMFATVRKSNKSFENSNRPMVRNGPRVLPVVKYLVHQEMKNVDIGSKEKSTCKCCHTCMSSGDSFMKRECNHNQENDNSVYTLCCHYPDRKRKESGMSCVQCRNINEDCHCEHETFNED